MGYLRQLTLRLRNLLFGRRADAELEREIASHLGLLEEVFQRRGLSAEEARYAALRAFGGVEQTKERQRDARSFVCLEDARRDIAYALRTLRRTSGLQLSLF